MASPSTCTGMSSMRMQMRSRDEAKQTRIQELIRKQRDKRQMMSSSDEEEEEEEEEEGGDDAFKGFASDDEDVADDAFGMGISDQRVK